MCNIMRIFSNLDCLQKDFNPLVLTCIWKELWSSDSRSTEIPFNWTIPSRPPEHHGLHRNYDVHVAECGPFSDDYIFDNESGWVQSDKEKCEMVLVITG